MTTSARTYTTPWGTIFLAAEVAAIRAELRAIFDPKAETGKGGC